MFYSCVISLIANVNFLHHRLNKINHRLVSGKQCNSEFFSYFITIF